MRKVAKHTASQVTGKTDYKVPKTLVPQMALLYTSSHGTATHLLRWHYYTPLQMALLHTFSLDGTATY